MIFMGFSDAVTAASWHFSFTGFKGNGNTCVKNMCWGTTAQAQMAAHREGEALGTSSALTHKWGGVGPTVLGDSEKL